MAMIAITFLALLALTGHPGATRAEADAAAPALQATLDAFYARHDLPGVTAAIVFSDGTVVVAAVGLADRENGVTMTPDTAMLAASIGKTFAGALVLSLEDEGLLRRSDPVVQIFPGDAWYAVLPNAGEITIGHLLNHASGLPDHVKMETFRSAMRRRISGGGDPLAPRDLTDFLAGEPALFPAGQGWAYADTNYIVLGRVIEAVAGANYFALVQARLLDPLDLHATRPSDRPDLPGLAVGYTAPDNVFALPVRTADDDGRLLWDPGVEWTGGGLASTSRDLACWGRALFTGRAMPGIYLERLLEGPVMDRADPDARYGAGVSIRDNSARGPVYGHAGWIPGYVSSLRHYADHGVTVAFQINSDAPAADDGAPPALALEQALADLAISLVDAQDGSVASTCATSQPG